MAQRITQEMFDSVMKENIADFEMSVDEALVDTIQQFKVQVCIQNILSCMTSNT